MAKITAFLLTGFIALAALPAAFASELVLQKGNSSYDGVIDVSLDDIGRVMSSEPLLSVTRMQTCHLELARTILRFDLSSIPKGATITSATLSLYLQSDNELYPSAPLSVHSITKPWDSGFVSWTNRTDSIAWDSAGGDLEGTDVPPFTYDSAASGVWVSTNITTTIKNLVADPSKNLGFIIKCPETSNVNLSFCSSESDSLSLRPKLTIEYEGGIPNAVAWKPSRIKVAEPQAYFDGSGLVLTNNDFSTISIMLTSGRSIVKALTTSDLNRIALPGLLPRGTYLIKGESAEGHTITIAVPKR